MTKPLESERDQKAMPPRHKVTPLDEISAPILETESQLQSRAERDQKAAIPERLEWCAECQSCLGHHSYCSQFVLCTREVVLALRTERDQLRMERDAMEKNRDEVERERDGFWTKWTTTLEQLQTVRAERDAAWNEGSQPPPITDTSHHLIHNSDEVLGFGKDGWVLARWYVWTDGKLGPCWMDKNNTVDVGKWRSLARPIPREGK